MEVETIARRIHAAGARADLPFVIVCAADFPTDSARLRARCAILLDDAAGGSLFMSDVETMPAFVQHRLIAVLDTLERARAPEVRARLVAGTTVSLFGRMEAGVLRAAVLPGQRPPSQDSRSPHRRREVQMSLQRRVTRTGLMVGRGSTWIDPMPYQCIAEHWGVIVPGTGDRLRESPWPPGVIGAFEHGAPRFLPQVAESLGLESTAVQCSERRHPAGGDRTRAALRFGGPVSQNVQGHGAICETNTTLAAERSRAIAAAGLWTRTGGLDTVLTCTQQRHGASRSRPWRDERPPPPAHLKQSH